MTLEERVAQLERQIASVSVQALSADTPSGYYTSKYSGEQIDNLLSGLAVEIGGSYANLAAIQAAFPEGDEAVYMAQDTGIVYAWNANTSQWDPLGKIQGPIGPQGDTGKSAYQYAVDGGYTGTEAQFKAMMSSVDIKAESAAASASAAENSKTAAAGSATTAEQAASSASSSAQTATSKAAEAQESASNAANSASSASVSASAAESNKTAAAQSATAASESSTQAASNATQAAGSATNAANSASSAASSAQTAQQYSGNPPIIQNGTWWTWNAEQQAYTDTGEAAQGPQGDVTMDQVNAAIDEAITETYVYDEEQEIGVWWDGRKRYRYCQSYHELTYPQVAGFMLWNTLSIKASNIDISSVLIVGTCGEYTLPITPHSQRLLCPSVTKDDNDDYFLTLKTYNTRGANSTNVTLPGGFVIITYCKNPES